MRYLQKYKGTYRVLAHYNQNTNDYPRDNAGNIDPSFDDLYIPCKKGQIYHHSGSTLVAYIPSLQKGRNIINKLNSIDGNIIFDVEETDGEVLFKFKSKHMDIVAGSEIMGIKTYGCDISPFSTKNLPKKKYIIPKEDLDRYNEAVKDINTKENMYLIRKLFVDFDKLIEKRLEKSMKKINKTKKMNKQFNINSEKRIRMLKGKEFIHSIGMWDEFIQFIKSNIKID